MGKQVVCVVGPTASGKTKLAVLLAKRFNGEVVSVDSMQIYRNMTIGTAAPTPEEMDGIPHHMVGVAAPTEKYSVARFAEEAASCVDDIRRRGKLPILAGGTGLYLDAILKGHGFAGGTSDGAVRKALEQRLEQEGIQPLMEALRAVDPASAERLNPADHKRILRALEVYQVTGKTITQHNEETKRVPPRYDDVTIGLAFRNRQEMRDLINQRVDRMVEDGLLQEINELLSSGVPRDATAWQAIGYKEFLGVADGEITEEQAIETVKARSRQYAKRQLTWLRRRPNVNWFYWENGRDFEAALQYSTDILTAAGIHY